MKKKKILITRKIPTKGIELLQKHFETQVWPEDRPIPEAELIESLKDKDGLLCTLVDHITSEIINQAHNLKVISNYAVGYNNIDISCATKENILVTNTPDVLTDATADLTCALLLNIARRITESSQYVKEGNWKTWEPNGHLGCSLSGKVLGIVGMGRIGQAVARKMHNGFGLKIVYYSRHPKPNIDKELSASHVELEPLLMASDFVSLHTDLNSSTQKMFSEKEFELMKPTSYLINTSRGALINEDSLLKALVQEKIKGAALDVTDPEPISVHSPLLSLKNCLITPHIGSATVKAREEMALLAANNLIEGLSGKKPSASVNSVQV